MHLFLVLARGTPSAISSTRHKDLITLEVSCSGMVVAMLYRQSAPFCPVFLFTRKLTDILHEWYGTSSMECKSQPIRWLTVRLDEKA